MLLALLLALLSANEETPLAVLLRPVAVDVESDDRAGCSCFLPPCAWDEEEEEEGTVSSLLRVERGGGGIMISG